MRNQRLLLGLVLLGIAWLLVAAPALAGEGGKGGVLSFTKTTMFWTAATFVVVLLILWKTAWGPILASLQERENKIRQAIEDAEKSAARAEELKKELEDKLEHARSEAEAIIKEGRDDAQRVKEKYEKEQRAEAEALKKRALNEIELAKGKALEEIRQEARAVSIEIATRVLEREVNAKDHEALVEETLAGYDRSVREMEGEGS